MVDIDTHYKGLNQECFHILNESLQPSRISAIARSHSFLFDYNNWISVLVNRPEYPIYRMALREYQMALLSNNIGLYNQAFLGLRFFLERSLVALLFSSKEIDLRLWLRGERDTYWQEIIDENAGVFSHSYCRAFFPDLKDEIVHFRRIAQKVYRECSEYVHGDLSVQSRIPETLTFNEFLFNEWNSKAEIIKRVLLFCFCLRYLTTVRPEDLNILETTTIENLGHLGAIRELFNQRQIKS